MSKFTTRTEGEGRSRIYVDGKPTDFFIFKGDPPKFGMHREWHLMHLTPESEGPVMTVYRRKSDALHAFALIWNAAQEVK